MLTHCISRRLAHIIPALLLLLFVYWLCLWVKMDKSLRLTGTPLCVNMGSGVAGDAAGNGTNCIAAAAAATTEPVTTADVPAEITGAAAPAAEAAKVEIAERPKPEEKAEKSEEAEEAGDKKKQKKAKKEEEEEEEDDDAEEKVVAKDVVAWWKQM
ncbi:hypothetical protein QBC45DRAFT_464453 [Copromyces sp. CBS 386.78]|nr:hypothetical protein QBC45DRAFT_464453 [Copromyces sp. CBS 386.78]